MLLLKIAVLIGRLFLSICDVTPYPHAVSFSLDSFSPPQTKSILLLALVAGASAFAPAFTAKSNGVALFSEPPKLGAGGMADTRDPEPHKDDDPRKSISEAPSFEEYLKQRAAEGGQ